LLSYILFVVLFFTFYWIFSFCCFYTIVFYITIYYHFISVILLAVLCPFMHLIPVSGRSVEEHR